MRNYKEHSKLKPLPLFNICKYGHAVQEKLQQ